MDIVEIIWIIGIILIFFGVIFIFVYRKGNLSDEENVIKIKNLTVKGNPGIFLILFGIILLILSFGFGELRKGDIISVLLKDKLIGIESQNKDISLPMPTSPSIITIKITEPKDGNYFPIINRSKIRGVISYLPNNQHLWIVMLKTNNIYYPFPDEPLIKGGNWTTTSYGVGEDNKDEDGETFIISAYLLDNEAYQDIKEYVKKETWNGMENLPNGAKKYDEIKVIGKL